MIKKLRTMFEMQRELTNKIDDKFHFLEDEHAYEKIFMAMLDEVGETIHELKPTWVWWKENPGEVDREKLLEEMVDIYHFTMTYALQLADMFVFDLRYYKNREDYLAEKTMIYLEEQSLYFEDIKNESAPSLWYQLMTLLHKLPVLDDFAHEEESVSKAFIDNAVELCGMILVAAMDYGYSFDEFYGAYLKKNQVNHTRQESHY